MSNIVELLYEQESLKLRIKNMIYGSIEIRHKDNKKYIYVHFREDGILTSKYVGEYNDELNNLILENNKLVKTYKKRLKEIKKELGLLQYVNIELSDDVKINIDLAKRNMADSIYKQAVLEGIGTTYSDTETIINGGRVNDMASQDILKVINLKHAWDFILSEGALSCPTNYVILCQINKLIEEGFSYTAGKLRSVPVHIGGSTYIPPLPFETQVKDDLNKIINDVPSYEIAVDMLLYIMKKQLFIDGNKRTAVIFANHYLIKRGMGIIVIPDNLVSVFKQKLIKYYESCDLSIKQFLLDNCITRLK